MTGPLEVGSLSLEEKAQLLSGDDTWTTFPVDRARGRRVVLADGPNGLRVQPREADNLGIYHSLPSTCFPAAVAVGSSWDPEVARELGEAIAAEARAFGVDLVLGPGINIKRSPLCGRNFEYYSEDPLLSGSLGAAHVGGLQSLGIGASVKHFAANNQETDRMRVNAAVDERTLREIYLPAFEQVVTTADPATVMCAYNRLNGVLGSENRWLLNDVLRGEWEYQGAVVSDWGAVDNRVASLIAGVDLEMPSTNGRGSAAIVASVGTGECEESIVDAAAERVIALGRLGHRDRADFDSEAHHALARKLASQCAILLKNDEALPLNPSAGIAVIGELARNPRFQGGGSSHVNPTRVDSALEHLRGRSTGGIRFEPGYTLDGRGDALLLREAAQRAAADADIAVVFAGLPESEESEGFDRDSLSLPADQVALIRDVARTAPKTVVVLNNGGVVSLEGWGDEVDAILECFLLGQAGGSATSDLLFGDTNPSGRLAETIPHRIEDVPSYLNFPGELGEVMYGERVFVGYRGFLTSGTAPRYPFGFGLSYTQFSYTDFAVTKTGPDTALVRVTVTNAGDRRGADVIQIYVAPPADGPVARPARELRAFRKVSLGPAEAMTIELPLNRRSFAYWDKGLNRWLIPSGEYAVQLGRNCVDIIEEARIALDGDTAVLPLSEWSTLQEWLDHPVVGPTLLDELDSDLLRELVSTDMLRMLGQLPMKKVFSVLGVSLPAGRSESLIARSHQDEKEVLP